MKTFKQLCGLAIVLSLLASCQKELSIETDNLPIPTQSAWEFTESGVRFHGVMDSASSLNVQGIYLLILRGVGDSGKNSELFLQIADTVAAIGEYKIPHVSFQYAEDGNLIYENIPTESNFSINITAIDSVSIAGTFSGTVTDAQGNRRVINDGKFSSFLSPVPVEEPPIFPPDTTETSPDSLKFVDVLTYANLDDPADTVKIVKTGDTVINGLTYTKMYNETRATTRYYRKAAGVFYEYLVPVAESFISAPLELVILQENGSQGTSWESPEYQYSSEPVNGQIPLTLTLKLRSTITRRDFSAMINGVAYSGLIEVTTHLFNKHPDGSFEDAGSVLVTVFAKNIGIVRYQQLDTGADYGIKNYL